jgi:hypothetical protein
VAVAAVVDVEAVAVEEVADELPGDNLNPFTH